jgi:hypothetical protein
VENPKLTIDICSKCRENIETFQHITGACRALTQADYTHYHHQVAKIVHQDLTIKGEPYKELPMLYFKYEPLSLLKTSQTIFWRDP